MSIVLLDCQLTKLNPNSNLVPCQNRFESVSLALPPESVYKSCKQSAL